MFTEYGLNDARGPLSDVSNSSDMSWTLFRLEQATTQIFEALKQMKELFGVETLLIVTRGDVNHPQFTKAHASPKTVSFLRNVVRTNASQLAEKLEGYAVSGVADGNIIGNTETLKQKEKIKAARDCILNSLVDLLREHNVPEDRIPRTMNYKSYKAKIMDQFGVELVGFPGDKGVVNPGELDVSLLKELLIRLNDGRCHWKMLNEPADLTANVSDHIFQMDDIIAEDTSSEASTRLSDAESVASYPSSWTSIDPSISQSASPDFSKPSSRAPSPPTLTMSSWSQEVANSELHGWVDASNGVSPPVPVHNFDNLAGCAQGTPDTTTLDLVEQRHQALSSFEACFLDLNQPPFPIQAGLGIQGHIQSTNTPINPMSFSHTTFHIDPSMTAAYSQTVLSPEIEQWG